MFGYGCCVGFRRLSATLAAPYAASVRVESATYVPPSIIRMNNAIQPVSCINSTNRNLVEAKRGLMLVSHTAEHDLITRGRNGDFERSGISSGR